MVYDRVTRRPRRMLTGLPAARARCQGTLQAMSVARSVRRHPVCHSVSI